MKQVIVQNGIEYPFKITEIYSLNNVSRFSDGNSYRLEFPDHNIPSIASPCKVTVVKEAMVYLLEYDQES